jgi:hypothetical protein
MLSSKQLAILELVVDRIIPPDGDPGGWESGVGDYLARQFERDLKDVVDVYRAGLDALDGEAQAFYGTDFAALTASAMDMLLSRLERGTVVTTWTINPAAFFALLVNHSMEGYYGDPGNGGNRNGASWKMIGFEVTG